MDKDGIIYYNVFVRKVVIIIPWVYSVSSGTPPTYTYSALNTLNQHCAKVNIPSSGAITQLKVFAAGYNGSVSARLVLWTVGGGVLQQSSTFTMSQGTLSGGGQFWYTKTITAKAVSSGNYWVGLYRNPSGGHIFGTVSSGDDGYRKTNTSSFPACQSMSGYSTHSGREPYVAAFYITAPVAPSSLSVTRNSDTNMTISWTRNASSDQPYTNIKLYRYDNITAAYYLKATLSGSATSYTDTSTSANKYYKYKVLATNAAGNSSYSNEDTIKTTPGIPADVEAARSGTTVNISWNDEATAENYFTIQRKTSTDGISWSSYSTLSSTIAANSESYIDSSPANYNQYQVRSDTTSPNTLHSNYSESNIVQILRYPDPPENVEPVDDLAIDIDGPIPITWTHNPVDDSAQTYYSIRFREYGGAWSLYVNKTASSTGASNVSTASFTVGRWEFEVRTWGAASTGGESSDGSGYYEGSGYTLGSFTLSTVPEGTITDPNGIDDYAYSVLTCTWSYSQDESNAQVQYICRLYDENDILLETKQASNADTSTVFVYALENATDYKVTLEVKESTGLWSVLDEVEFTTDFYVPPTPTIEIETGDNATAIITITNPSPSGTEVATDHNTLYRSVDGTETWQIVKDNIEPNTSVTDYIPLLNGTTYYYVEAVSATPSMAVSSQDSITLSLIGEYYLNSGDEYSDYIKLYGDVSLSERFGIDVKTQMYEGRTYPVTYKGSRKTEQLSFSCDLENEYYETLKNIVESEDSIYYRDYLNRWYEIAVIDSNLTKKDQYAYQFQATFLRVESD